MKRRGSVVDARTGGLRWLSWELAEDAELSRAKQVNPASWITTEQLREQRQRLPEIAFRRYICNQWTTGENYWLPAGAWQACAGETRFEDGERIVIGVDIGGERSDSAVVWLNESPFDPQSGWRGVDTSLGVPRVPGRGLPGHSPGRPGPERV